MADNDNPKDPAQLSLGGIVTNLPAVRAARKVNTLSRVHRRLIEPVELTEQDNAFVFQHAVFCQTGLPYRNPGDGLRLWERQQGSTILHVQAGHIANPATRQMAEVGLPWGANPGQPVSPLTIDLTCRRGIYVWPFVGAQKYDYCRVGQKHVCGWASI